MIDQIKLAIKQWWCDHSCRQTQEWFEDRVMMSQTKCSKCGKGVPEFDNPYTSMERMKRYSDYITKYNQMRKQNDTE